MKLRTPALVVLPVSLLLVVGCGGSSSPKKQADKPGAATTAPSAGGSASKPTAKATSTARPGSTTSATAAAKPGASTAAARPGGLPAAAARSTAPGAYTYDIKGKATYSTQTQDLSGTATLKVDKAVGERQHSSLSGDQGGGTQQDVVHRADGTYLARLVLNAGTQNKEFRPAKPVLGVPSSYQQGRTWSWTMTSTDGKTTAAYNAAFSRTERVTIGGTSIAAWVIESTLKVTGDFTITQTETTDYDPTRLLQVRQHARGSGNYMGIAFTSDTTNTMRSVRPS